MLSDKDLVSLVAEYDKMTMLSQPGFYSIRLMQMEYEKDFHRQIRFAGLKRLEPRGFWPGGVAGFDIDAMKNDPNFDLALNRLARFQTFFQIWHQYVQESAREVLDHLSGGNQ